jgi:hypothetical protein
MKRAAVSEADDRKPEIELTRDRARRGPFGKDRGTADGSDEDADAAIQAYMPTL